MGRFFRGLFQFLYGNIGGKLKIFAKIIFFAGVAVAFMSGIIVTFERADMASMEPPIGLFILLLGPAISWLLSIGLYAFGQLIENSDTIASCATFTVEKQIESERAKDAEKFWQYSGNKIGEENNGQMKR